MTYRRVKRDEKALETAPGRAHQTHLRVARVVLLSQHTLQNPRLIHLYYLLHTTVTRVHLEVRLTTQHLARTLLVLHRVTHLVIPTGIHTEIQTDATTPIVAVIQTEALTLTVVLPTPHIHVTDLAVIVKHTGTTAVATTVSHTTERTAVTLADARKAEATTHTAELSANIVTTVHSTPLVALTATAPQGAKQGELRKTKTYADRTHRPLKGCSQYLRAMMFGLWRRLQPQRT